MATDNELRHLGDALALVVERLIEPVEGMHGVISERAFRYLGPPGVPVRAVHDTMVGGVYETIRRGAFVVGAGVGAIWAARLPAANPVSESRSGSGLQAALNAVWGDRLDERGNALAVSLTVRDAGRAVTAEPASLAAAYPGASSHIVVLLHGLGQTEHCWQSSPRDGGTGLYESLAADSDFSPVPIRYNSGLPVARNGEEVAALLAALCQNWPAAHPRVSLVGYSMGGLVARSAYAAGMAAGHGWASNVQHLITIGTPHLGSSLARGVSVASRALRLARTSRPLGEFLDAGSSGINDLRDGAGIARVWEQAVASPPGGSTGMSQHFVAAVVTGDSRHPVGALVGDLIVRVPSATGQAVTSENVRVLGGRRHFDLLADQDVGDQILDWLGSPSRQRGRLA